jgi:hypothetical protein
MISLIAAAAAFSATYSCQVSQPEALHTGPNVQLTPITIPEFGKDDGRFTIQIARSEALDVRVVWPNDPIQVAGKFPALITADGSVAFSAYSTGPCTFTESMCMTLFNLVDHGNGSADVILLPAALATKADASDRNPFVVVIRGTCTRPEDRK